MAKALTSAPVTPEGLWLLLLPGVAPGMDLWAGSGLLPAQLPVPGLPEALRAFPSCTGIGLNNSLLPKFRRAVLWLLPEIT